MNASSHPERFHALDATRAFALLLGVVFHAAWSFVPSPMGGPVLDASAGRTFDWFFFTSHTFRMQLFFLMAGFFAHLVCHRGGFMPFAVARLARIGVPLVAGWLVLYPMLMAVWTTGGNLSGRNLLDVSHSSLFNAIYEKGLILVPRNAGGMFSLWHLWFLYYLLLLYAMVLGFRWLLTRIPPVMNRLRLWADLGIGHAMRSRWSLVWLTLGMGCFLWPMQGWFGVDTPAGSLAPSAPVLFFYGAFFVFGWLLHRQAGLLKHLARDWRWQLPLGLALSIPLFAAYQSMRERGISKEDYPRLTATQITDWSAFLKRLQTAGNPADAPAELASLWAHFSPGARERILELSGDADAYQRAGVARAMAKLLVQPAMFLPEAIPPGFKPPPEEAARALVENRAKLDHLFAGSLAGDPRRLGWYRPTKLAYSMAYGLAMWLLLFGTLGFFQAQMPGHSPGWRYVADSSYWIYLAHLPLMAALQIWMAPWQLPGAIKFFLLNFVVFAILFATYHFVVRSTFIGLLLNGRRHPFVAWPFRKADWRPAAIANSTQHGN